LFTNRIDEHSLLHFSLKPNPQKFPTQYTQKNVSLYVTWSNDTHADRVSAVYIRAGKWLRKKPVF